MNKYKLTFYFSLLCWAAFAIWVLIVPAKSEEIETDYPSTHKEILIQAIVAASDVDKPAQEPVTYEDWFKANANVIENCTVTHYCCEQYEHICGNGDGLTATGTPVTPYWTCAVDPSVIPYGSEIMIDYGDHVEFWKAQDCGASIKGERLDLAVIFHSEALSMGVKNATVYWMENTYVQY